MSRLTKPRANSVPSVWEGANENPIVGGHAASRCRRVKYDKEPRHDDWPPTKAICDDSRGETILYIEPADRVVDGRELGLDLNDQCEALVGSKREEIDASALGEYREGHLSRDLPTEVREVVGNLAQEERVPFIQQAVDLPAPPADQPFVPSVDRREREPEHSRGEGCEVTPLDEGNGLLRNPSRAGNVQLPKSAAAT